MRLPAAVVLAFLLVVSACSRGSDQEAVPSGGKYGSGVDLGALDDKIATAAPSTPTVPGAAGTTTGGGTGSTGGGSAQAPAGQAPAGGGKTVTGAAVDTGALGANAVAYLRSQHSQLVIEINAAEGKAPKPSAIALLKTRLAEVLDKPGGIKVLPTKTFKASKPNYTMNDVKNLERQHRKEHSDRAGPKAVLHILYVNGRLSDGENVLGVAYGASSIVMVPDRIGDAANPVVNAEMIERAVLVHEAGHILGMVNIGYKSPRDHEDPEHSGHSKNSASVMYWAVNTFDVATLLAGEPPTAFDADDKADLADRKAG